MADGSGSAGLFSEDAGAFTAFVLPICHSCSHWSSLNGENDDTSSIFITRHVRRAVLDVGRAVFVDCTSHNVARYEGRVDIVYSVGISRLNAYVTSGWESDGGAIYVPAKMERAAGR
jgi:hypothetical protein